jgi:hypothetical protein
VTATESVRHFPRTHQPTDRGYADTNSTTRKRSSRRSISDGSNQSLLYQAYPKNHPVRKSDLVLQSCVAPSNSLITNLIFAATSF